MVIFGGYDVLLPMVLIFIIKNTLDQRVVTLPEPDLSLHPNLPPNNKFSLHGINVSCLIPALLIMLPFIYLALANQDYLSISSTQDMRDKFTQQQIMTITANGGAASVIDQGLYLSYFITFGLFLSISVFFLLNSFQRLKLRKEILEMEDEFREVLFGVGQEIDRGIPIEIALTKVAPTLRGQYSAKLIEKIIDNINYKGMTFEMAIFDETEGAIRYFPSKLIHSVMKAVVDASKKGTKISSEVMISISKYLSDIHRTQETIIDKFSEILSGMKLQAQILLPLICAIMSVITWMIIQMMSFLGDTMKGLQTTGALTGYSGLLNMFQNVEISPAIFQLSIGIYAIETIIILSWFMNGIVRGTDKVSLYDSIGKNLLVGGIIYLIIAIVAIMMFQPFIVILKTGMGAGAIASTV
jgi:hypothetical protein